MVAFLFLTANSIASAAQPNPASLQGDWVGGFMLDVPFRLLSSVVVPVSARRIAISSRGATPTSGAANPDCVPMTPVRSHQAVASTFGTFAPMMASQRTIGSSPM
jgi:hypothetical protein